MATTKNLQLSGRTLSSWLKVVQFHCCCHISAQLPQRLRMKPLALHWITGTEHCAATLATQATTRLSHWSSDLYTGSTRNPSKPATAACTSDTEKATSNGWPRITDDSRALPPFHNSPLKAHRPLERESKLFNRLIWNLGCELRTGHKHHHLPLQVQGMFLSFACSSTNT